MRNNARSKNCKGQLYREMSELGNATVRASSMEKLLDFWGGICKDKKTKNTDKMENATEKIKNSVALIIKNNYNEKELDHSRLYNMTYKIIGKDNESYLKTND